MHFRCQTNWSKMQKMTSLLLNNKTNKRNLPNHSSQAFTRDPESDELQNI